MPIRTFDGKSPKLHPTVYVNELAYISGDVEMGENCNVWPGASIRGDSAKIVIGKGCSVQDGVVIHCDDSIVIEDQVLMGHGAIVHGRRIGHNTLIGINATILDQAEVGEFCVIGANALVSAKMKVPPGSFVVGVPGQIKGPITASQRKYLETIGQFYVARSRRYIEQGL